MPDCEDDALAVVGFDGKDVQDVDARLVIGVNVEGEDTDSCGRGSCYRCR